MPKNSIPLLREFLGYPAAKLLLPTVVPMLISDKSLAMMEEKEKLKVMKDALDCKETVTRRNEEKEYKES